MKKVLVVGAGVAGLVVCYWLKKFGFSPTLIEKSNAFKSLCWQPEVPIFIKLT